MVKFDQIRSNLIPFSVLMIFLMIGCSIFGKPSVNSDTLRFEVLLNQKMLAEDSISIDFITSVEVTSSQLILLSSVDRYYLLGWGGLKTSGQPLSDSISAFAYTPDGFLLMVSRSSICFLDSTGKLEKLQNLPNDSMGISSGENVMYLYDREKNKEKYPLYVLTKGGLFAGIFDMPDPISAVAEINKTILFSSLNTLFAFDPKTKKLEAMASLEKGDEIISIAINPKTNTIYFSSKNAIYALKEHGITLITDKFGGTIKYFNHSLMVFDAEKKFLIRMVGFEK